MEDSTIYLRNYLNVLVNNQKDFEDVHSGDTVYGYYANWNGPIRKMGTVVDTCRHTVEFVENYPELAKRYPRSWGLFKKNPDDDKFIIYLDENDQLNSGTYTTDKLHGLIVLDDSSYEDALRAYKIYEEKDRSYYEAQREKNKQNKYKTKNEEDTIIDLTVDSDVDDLIEHMLDILCYEQGCNDARDNENLLEELVYPLYERWVKSQPEKISEKEAKDSLKEFINKPSILKKVWKYVDDEE